jgi:hypothetical protein
MSTRARAVPGSGAARMRRALALAGCSVLTVGLTACESTEQESSRLGRESEAAAKAAETPKPASKTHAGGRSHSHTHTSTHAKHAKAPASP